MQVLVAKSPHSETSTQALGRRHKKNNEMASSAVLIFCEIAYLHLSPS
jgi:hypothetical protein